MLTMNGLYSADYDFPTSSPIPAKRIMIAAIPRTGSTLFGLNLWRTGLLGAPLEYLNLQRQRDMVLRLGGDSVKDYWSKLPSVRSSPNGVFSFKAFMQDLHFLRRKYPEILTRVDATHVIFITRRDKIGQAISYVRAIQSGSWFYDQPKAMLEKFDPGSIEKNLNAIAELEGAWEALFDKKGTNPLRLCYEEICASPEGATRKALEFVGIPWNGLNLLEIPSIEIQRDALTEKWRSDFLAHIA